MTDAATDPGSADGTTLARPLDLLVSGPVFFDLVMVGLPHRPVEGTETWASGMGTSPGGAANLTIAAARLGLRTGLASAFGDDAYAEWLWEILADQERVDLTGSWRLRHWHTAVTVSMAFDGDRTMVSHGHTAPPRPAGLPSAPRARAVVGQVDPPRTEAWWKDAAAQGSLVFLDGGWDPTETWQIGREQLDGAFAFSPNLAEALRITRTDTAEEALRALGEHVPFPVVTLGADGAMALDEDGTLVHEPALHVDAIDPTGAGDIFAAALVHGTLEGWDVSRRLRLGALCSALAVQHFGGSLSAPGWGDIVDWWTQTVARAQTGDADARETADRYEFLADMLPRHEWRRVRRAEATLARGSDAQMVSGAQTAAIPVLRTQT